MIKLFIILILSFNSSSDINKVTVTIAGSKCDLSSINNNQIDCRTNSYSQSSIKALIQVFIQDSGLAVSF